MFGCQTSFLTKFLDYTVSVICRYLQTVIDISLEPFHKPQMSLFSGAATAIVQTSDNAGDIVFEAKAKGVKPAKLTITAL